MLEVRNLAKRYGSRPVLNGLSFTIEAGDLYTLLGPNGAGKTTTINIITGLLAADQGTVSLDGRTLTGRKRAQIGIAPQDNLIYRSLTCAENLMFFGRLYGFSGRKLRDRVQAGLESVNLADRADTLASRLSGGMQRRLNLAIATVHAPRLLILDEPTAGLDVEARYDIWEFVRGLQRLGTSILLTTHLLDEAQALSQRLGILKDGRLVVEGNVEELIASLPSRDPVAVETSDEAAAIARGRELGFIPRRYAGKLHFWLPQRMELQQVAQAFTGIALEGIVHRPLHLEYCYLEATGHCDV